MSHGHPWTTGEIAKIRKFQHPKVAHSSGINLQLAIETGEFSQVPSLSMGVHGPLSHFY